MTEPMLPQAIQEQLQAGAAARMDLDAARQTITQLREELTAIRDMAYRGVGGPVDALEAIHHRASRAVGGGF